MATVKPPERKKNKKEAKMHFTLSTAGLESFYKGIPLLITYILSYYIQNELRNTKTTSVPGREKIRL